MQKLSIIGFIFIIILFTFSGCQSSENDELENDTTNSNWEIVSCEYIDSCASDFNIRYSMAMKNDIIVVGYYDKNHQLTLGKRDRGGQWSFTKLDEFADYDTHKYISLIIDRDGIIHLCANMHASPLVYYKGSCPYSIENLTKQDMVGINENDCTYPTFMIESSRLIFHYRSGVSGNGCEIFNEYNYDTKTWRRLLDQSLFDGKGQSNSYFLGPILGKDNRYHLVWCWRDTGDCVTNHGLYHAYSYDLIYWYNMSGDVKEIPITPSDNQYLIDDIPVKAGLLNSGGYVLGFFEDCKPYVVYHKYDENDKTNVFLATVDDKHGNIWKLTKITDWNWKWEFSGYGSIVMEFSLVKTWCNNNIYCVYNKIDSSTKILCFNTETKVITTTDYQPEYPIELETKILDHSEKVHIVYDDNISNEYSKYLIRYETLDDNRDHQLEIAIHPSPLFLYKVIK